MRLGVIIYLKAVKDASFINRYLDNLRLATKFQLYVISERPIQIWSEATHQPLIQNLDEMDHFLLVANRVKKKHKYLLRLQTNSPSRSVLKTQLDPLFKDLDSTKNSLKLLKGKTGILGSKGWIITIPTDWGLYRYHIQNLTDPPDHPTEFISGNFWIKTSLIPELVSTRDTYELDWPWYILYYADLRTSGITTKDQAVQHWKFQGEKENRIPNGIVAVQRSLPDLFPDISSDTYERYFGVLADREKLRVVGV